jgi:hypothetical protein
VPRRLACWVPILLTCGTAHAGRTFYGWLYGTEVLPERGAEAASWIAEENDIQDEDHVSETRWWVAPLIGINDQLELAIPAEIAWTRSDGQPGHTAFDRYGAELRYRLVTQDPVDAPPYAALVRVALKRSITERQAVIPEADFVASYQTGIVHVLADVGMYGELASECPRGNPTCTSDDKRHFEVRPGAGFSIQAVGDLRFGGEVHAELTLDQGGNWAVVGPNMAWSHGRFWMSATYGIGIYGIKDAPKIQWGLAF